MEPTRHPGEIRQPGNRAAEPDRRRLADFDLVVADASWSWTERLFTPLADLGVRVLLLKACDWRTALNQGRPPRDWFRNTRRIGARLWERSLVLPPGWMKTYPRLGMQPLARAVRLWRQTLEEPRPLALAISYPHYLYLRDLVRPDALIYYNMDDYAFYWTSRGRSIRNLERRAVRDADLSVFCAKIRAEELREQVADASERIVHLPHGAPAGAIAPEPLACPAAPPSDLATLPRPLLGFVGSLEDRIDWPLMERVAQGFASGSIILIGREPTPTRRRWYQHYRRAVALPNVHKLGWKTQAEIARYNAAFDVCLIPYRTDHPFNRAACPTKVMDYMATSRPVVSTALPECRLYGHLFDVAETPEAFVAAIHQIVRNGSDDGRAVLRWQLARETTWEHTAELLLRHFEARKGRRGASATRH
jgi:glycosyltransferase involved in cell wall biosynthesis